MLVDLNYLQTGLCTFLDDRAFWYGYLVPAECSVACLIEAIYQCDVEDGSIVTSKPHVDECVGPGMTTLEDERSSIEWPLCATRVRIRLVNASTCS